jgi:ABC-2 type transport system ATP-binding protein
MTPIIEARALSKRFGKVQALAGLDLVVESGQVVALLGPNGAGKTTFVRCLATLLRPDDGTLRIGGHDVVVEAAKARTLIGLAGQFAAVEGAMTGRENLELVARLYGQPRREARANATATLARLGLADSASRLVRTYSGGMRRKLDLGASLVGSPRLLLLDEPTTGLDPGSRIDLWDTIRELVGRGTDVLLTTQYLDEADQLADRIVIMDHGSVIADGTPDELKSLAGRDVVEVHLRDSSSLHEVAQALRTLGSEEPSVDTATRRVSVSVGGGTEPLMAAARALDERGLDVDNLSLRRPTLDEVFLTLTGHDAAA